MPYLFWMTVPFALMETWWNMCEQRRDGRLVAKPAPQKRR